VRRLYACDRWPEGVEGNAGDITVPSQTGPSRCLAGSGGRSARGREKAVLIGFDGVADKARVGSQIPIQRLQQLSGVLHLEC
jgi:hypothetical protein